MQCQSFLLCFFSQVAAWVLMVSLPLLILYPISRKMPAAILTQIGDMSTEEEEE